MGSFWKILLRDGGGIAQTKAAVNCFDFADPLDSVRQKCTDDVCVTNPAVCDPIVRDYQRFVSLLLGGHI